MKKYCIYISLCLNLLLVGALVYVGGVKTDYFKRVKARVTGEMYVPARLDDNCVASWNSCIRKLNLDADVVFFGNSITEGGEWQEYFSDKKVVVMGYIGDDTKGMLRRVEAIASVKPEKVFLMAGVNGLKKQSWEDFDKWYGVLLDRIIEAVPNATLYVQSILPVADTDFCSNEKIREANEHIRSMAADRGLMYVDLYAIYQVKGALPMEFSYDGLHLQPDAYTKWVDAIQKYIEE